MGENEILIKNYVEQKRFELEQAKIDVETLARKLDVEIDPTTVTIQFPFSIVKALAERVFAIDENLENNVFLIIVNLTQRIEALEEMLDLKNNSKGDKT